MVEKTMFYGAKPAIFEKAKLLRDNMTEAERALWISLQKKKIMGFRFKPQHPIDKFIADFYCHKLKLVIEVDGGIHKIADNKEYDIGREAELNEFGIMVLRFSNEEIIDNKRKVVKTLIKICKERLKEIQNESPL
ncbi:endonuclease domain-containing protein [Bacteroidota bacterium]